MGGYFAGGSLGVVAEFAAMQVNTLNRGPFQGLVVSFSGHIIYDNISLFVSPNTSLILYLPQYRDYLIK